MQRIRLLRSISKRGHAMLVNIRGLVPEHFVGKVYVELVALGEREVLIRIVKVEPEKAEPEVKTPSE